MADQKKFLLSESDIPTQWYNVSADLPTPLDPALHPGTGQPAGPEDFAPLFPMELIMQEVSQDRWIDIPDPVRDMYRVWRPTPLIRATGLEKALGTPAKIFYKYEGTSPVGSHKPNTAIAQAFYNKQEGTKRIVTETGAGQWGSAIAYACQQFGIESKIFMVSASFDQKPYRKTMMAVKLCRAPAPKPRLGGRSWRRIRTRPDHSESPFPKPSKSRCRATIQSTRWVRC